MAAEVLLRHALTRIESSAQARSPTRTRRTRLLWPALALALTSAGVGGCGGSGGGGASVHGTTQPGAGRPPVTLGTKVSPVSVLLGQLYAQALRAHGYSVELQEIAGNAGDAVAALRHGRIDAMALPVDALDEALGVPARDAPSAAAAYAQGRAAAATHGLELLAPTPFAAATALAVLPAYAQRHDLVSIADLARLGRARLGASPGFRARPGVGLPGLQRVYGLTSLTYFPLTTDVRYDVLTAGKIDVAEVATTDGELSQGTYTVLRDPRHLFGFEHVAPVATVAALSAEGPAFARTLDAVSAKLTPRAMQQLNAGVALDHNSPEQVAREFLREHGLG